jgi:hypothetical protein
MLLIPEEDIVHFPELPLRPRTFPRLRGSHGVTVHGAQRKVPKDKAKLRAQLIE